MEEGDTVRDPVTVPMPWLMDRLSALLTLQLRVELPPWSMVVGLAVKLLMVGAFGFGGAFPVTETESNRDPRLPLE